MRDIDAPSASGKSNGKYKEMLLFVAWQSRGVVAPMSEESLPQQSLPPSLFARLLSNAMLVLQFCASLATTRAKLADWGIYPTQALGYRFSTDTG